MAHIDEFRKYATDEVSDLSWEIIEARGIKAGDVMALWRASCALSLGIEPMMDHGSKLCNSLDLAGRHDLAEMLSIDYSMLAAYIKRDVSEIMKFLVKKNFHFPDLSLEDLYEDGDNA